MTDIEARLRGVPWIMCKACAESCAHDRPDYPALAAVVREMVEAHDVEFARAIADVFDGMACDPTCDSFAHAETCPATHGPSAVRSLRARLAEQAREVERLRGKEHALHARAVAAEHDWQRAETELERLHGEVELRDGEVGSLDAWVTQLKAVLSAYHRADYHDGPCYEWEGECHPAQSSPATFPQHSSRCRTTRAALRATVAEQAGEVERLHAAYDTLTGERFSDRVHVALRQRIDSAHTEIERLREALRTTEGYIRYAPPTLCEECIADTERCSYVPSCVERDRNYQFALKTLAAALRATPEAGG